MHLGFHIYDLGFQSPDSEAAKPMVFATTFLLIALVVILNLGAIIIRRARFAENIGWRHFDLKPNSYGTRFLLPMTSCTNPTNVPENEAQWNAQLNDRYIQVKDFNFFYGAKQALHEITFDIPEKQISALIGPVRLRKDDASKRKLNRMNDLIPGVSHGGDILVHGRSIYDPKSGGDRAA